MLDAAPPKHRSDHVTTTEGDRILYVGDMVNRYRPMGPHRCPVCGFQAELVEEHPDAPPFT